MTGQEQKDLFTELLGGETLSDTYFLTLLNTAKSLRENERPWRKLVREDGSLSASTSDTYETLKSLPTDFRRFLPRRTLFLKSGSSVEEYEEILAEQKYEYKDTSGYFYADHYQSKLALCGSVSQSYDIKLFYICASPDITMDSEWIFPEEFHKGIVFDAAAMHQLGADYDDVNARKGNSNAIMGDRIAKSMARWDAELQRSALLN